MDFENEPKDLEDYYKLHEFKKRDIDISSIEDDKELKEMIKGVNIVIKEEEKEYEIDPNFK